MNLNDKQKRFCEEYIIDLNATQASIRAGYSEKTAKEIGCENLTKPNIQEYISELIKDRSYRTEITADRVIQELAKIGFSNISDYLTVIEKEIDVEGKKGKESKKIKYIDVDIFKTEDVGTHKMAVVSEIKRTKDGISIKLHDKVKALEDLGKHLGIFKEDNSQKTPTTKQVFKIGGQEIEF